MKCCLFLLALYWAALLNSACTPSMQQMRDRFRAEVDTVVGLSFEDLKKDNFIGNRAAAESRELDSGNYLYVYKKYWVQYGIQREPCDVFLEVNPKTNIVVAAYAQGDGCFMPY